MNKYIKIALGVNLVLFLFFFNKMVADKEQTLENGRLVFLRLAPVDPRSLMQGDYMDLRYAISRDVRIDEIPKRGYCQLSLDSNDIATKVITATKKRGTANSDEIWIRYFHNERRLQFGAESYFFQEGNATKYDSAQYGAIKVDDKGNTVLVGLYNRQLQLIE